MSYLILQHRDAERDLRSKSFHLISLRYALSDPSGVERMISCASGYLSVISLLVLSELMTFRILLVVSHGTYHRLEEILCQQLQWGLRIHSYSDECAVCRINREEKIKNIVGVLSVH
jgi:hypothetical protein